MMENGVDMPRGRVSEEAITAATTDYDLPEGVPVFLFVGRMMWYKGLRIILDTLKLLQAGDQDFRMVFIGSGADAAEVQEYAKPLGSKCIFTGAISQRETLRAWYCRADLFLFPSSYDTNGLVVREAAACDLAAVLIDGSEAAGDLQAPGMYGPGGLSGRGPAVSLLGRRGKAGQRALWHCNGELPHGPV